MKGFKITTLFFSSCALLTAQRSALKISSREVILTEKDTVIKISILKGQSNLEVNPERVYFWYLKGKVNSNAGGYSGRLLNGPYEVIINNNLRTVGQFERGLKTGTWKSWYDTGKLYEITGWNEGVLDGEHMSFKENGERIKGDIYKNGHLKETHRKYSESPTDGHIISFNPIITKGSLKTLFHKRDSATLREKAKLQLSGSR